ncbi:hypothetical protein ACFVKB_36485 [Rhodococcus sp. NPDC127530]|uniref:hypothetical protein n=1 Tax=unclassified Rhodococcus (in: high G+C Gram-positive bacteria) TaxID=192944 RepID=UPI0036358908
MEVPRPASSLAIGEHPRTTIVEGILDVDRYGGKLERLATAADSANFYAFDLTYEQTLDRHATCPQAAEFTPADMHGWYRGRPLPFTIETVLDASWSADAVVNRIYEDLHRA